MSFFSTEDFSRFALFETAAVSPIDLEASNLATERVNNRWRAGELGEGATRVTLDVTFDEAALAAEGFELPLPLNYLFVQRPRYSRRLERRIGPTFSATDTLRIILYADEIDGEVVTGGDTGDVASGMQPGIGVTGLWREAGVSIAALRLEFDALSRSVAPKNFFDMGALRLGPAHKFHVDYIGLTEGLDSNSSIERPSLGASALPRKGSHWRLWDLLFRCIDEDEREQVRAFLLDNYDGSQFVFGHDETRPWDTWMLAAMINPDLQHASTNFRRLPVQLQEAL